MQEEHRNLRDAFQNQLLRSRIEVQEQTYQQIGKELHDNVGQLLSTSRMLIGLTERELPTPPDTLVTANATLAQAIAELRSLARALDKDWLEQFSFSQNIQTMISRINAGQQLVVTYSATTAPPFSSSQQIILFRMVQEAVQNAIKHANASTIGIHAEQQQEIYTITVTDNGKGFAVAATPKSMGLSNMKQRAQLMGGTLTLQAAHRGGTTVIIRLPVVQQEG
jgi:signal transduction histidine kinase